MNEAPQPDAEPVAPQVVAGAERWDFEEWEEFAPGRLALTSLGGGKRYEVYLVWDDRLYTLAVAKILRPNRVADEGSRRSLRREAALLRRLAHPVIVRGFEADLDSPVPHLLLEHLDGPTLGGLIRDSGALELEQLLPLVMEVTSALHYLSTEGLVHLDVKPANIVMGAPPRLIDLSLARSLERAAEVKSVIGTDAYMPPEQCDPAAWPGRIGTASDVWGLGATLYHAATGEVPFPRPRRARTSEDPKVRFPQLVEDPLPPKRRMPSALAELMLHMLAREPGDRPTPAEVVDELAPLVGAPPRKARMRRRFRRRAPRVSAPGLRNDDRC